MHEMAMVSSIFNVINDKIKEYGINKVKQVKLVVGEMTGVEDYTMKACFELFAEATPVEGALLVIERIPIKVKCRSCGNEYIASNMRFRCASCGGTNINIISGKELYIENIEAE